MKYVTLLRGINVGGHKKVAMADLKQCFQELGFQDVVTYINSGNVIFDTAQTDKADLVNRCEVAIEAKFSFKVACSVITVKELKLALHQVPEWWGKVDDASHNALFAIAPTTAKEALQALGPIKTGFEQVFVAEPIIFWSAARQTIGRSRYSKIVGTKAYQNVTVRNANTTRKLLELSA
ncbi:MAG: DUF1697 domain-containing protein [Candidatus Saccharimonadales bacterium]